MAVGWAKDGAIQDQIDASIDDAVQAARARLPQGQGSDICDNCGASIAAARRAAMPSARLCLSCQEQADHQQQHATLYNRRGSKDSQLR